MGSSILREVLHVGVEAEWGTNFLVAEEGEGCTYGRGESPEASVDAHSGGSPMRGLVTGGMVLGVGLHPLFPVVLPLVVRQLLAGVGFSLGCAGISFGGGMEDTMHPLLTFLLVFPCGCIPSCVPLLLWFLYS